MFRYLAFMITLILSFSAFAKGMAPINPNEVYFLKDYGRCQIIRPTDDGKNFEVLQNGLSIKLVPKDAFNDPSCMKLSDAGTKDILKFIKAVKGPDQIAPSLQTESMMMQPAQEIYH